jgi:hypothetical protein
MARAARSHEVVTSAQTTTEFHVNGLADDPDQLVGE